MIYFHIYFNVMATMCVRAVVGCEVKSVLVLSFHADLYGLFLVVRSNVSGQLHGLLLGGLGIIADHVDSNLRFYELFRWCWW